MDNLNADVMLDPVADDVEPAPSNEELEMRDMRARWKALTVTDASLHKSVLPGPAGRVGLIYFVQGDSMVDADAAGDEYGTLGGVAGTFPDRLKVIVDPAVEAIPGAYVVVRLNAREVILRVLEREGATLMLRALNRKYPKMPLPADAKIVGVVVGKIIERWELDSDGRRIVDRPHNS